MRWSWLVVVAIACGDNMAVPVDALAGDGASCSRDDECAAGHCVANVCCNTACEALEACSTPSCVTGTCTYVEAAACGTPACGVASSCPATDGDGDGLADRWEQNGYIDVNCNGIQDAGDVALPGANPNVPDIYVQYDWMDYGPMETPCNVTPDCTIEAGLAGFTCTGPQLTAGYAHSCEHACTTDGECTALGATHVADKCDAATSTCFHSHDPALLTPPSASGALPSSLERVVEAFAARGYALHVIRGHAHAHSHVVTFHTDEDVTATCEGSATAGVGQYAVSIFDLKRDPTGPFDPALAPFVHYALFGHYNSCDSVAHCAQCPVAHNRDGTPKSTSAPVFRSSGVAELPGNDLIVTLTNYSEEVGNPPDDANIGGTFMHELGHNLGLRHGGGDDVTFKPNYLSVMNYTYQFVGVPTTAGPRLDFSSTAVLPASGVLDESALDESVGLGGVATDQFFFTDAACNFQVASTSGAVDWDGDMVAGDNASVIADLNPQAHPALPCSSDTTEMFAGHTDWLATGGQQPIGQPFTYAYQCTSSYGDGAGPPEDRAMNELTAATAATAHVALAPLVAKIVRSGSGCTLAILGSPKLDVARIERATLRAGRARPSHVELADVDGDGRLDLVARYPTASRIRITGTLVGGRAFSGAASCR